MAPPKKSEQKGSSHLRGTLLQQINNCPIPPEDMLAIVEAFQALPGEDRDMEGGILLTSRHFDGHPRRFDLSRSAFYRLLALANLLVTDKLRGWAEQANPEEPTAIHTALLAAAGEVPVTFARGDFRFQRKALLQAAFRLAAQMKRS
jgi:hypothetical protein